MSGGSPTAADGRAANPYVFIVGSPRSGTTLLRRIVDAHPQLAVILELRWLSRFWRHRTGLTRDGLVMPELVDRIVDHRRFVQLGLPRERLEGLAADGRPKHYARFVTELFDLYGECRDKPFVGEKNPEYVRRLPVLSELWPTARFVHVIRDGRDVALSMLSKPVMQVKLSRFSTWETDQLVTSALYWEWNVRRGREAGASLGPGRYYELRYEALVADPVRESRRLCAFLGLPYDAGMLDSASADPTVKRAWQPVTAGLRNWPDEMAPEDVSRFEAAVGPLLEELGYERTGHPSSAESNHVACIRHAFGKR